MSEENVLYQSHPAMFRSRPVLFLVCICLVALYGLGLLILAAWALRCYGTTLTITEKRTTSRKGILSKQTNEIKHSDVKQLKASQKVLQRIFNVGTVELASAGTGGIEINEPGMPNPQKAIGLIRQYQEG